MNESFWPRPRSVAFDPASESVRRARDLIREMFAEARVRNDTLDTALLLVSELVTNAVLHGRGQAVLDADLGADLLRVAVTDDSPTLPEVQHNEGLLTDGGRGMLLVEQMATRWGVEATAVGGKSVWFELHAPAAE